MTYVIFEFFEFMDIFSSLEVFFLLGF